MATTIETKLRLGARLGLRPFVGKGLLMESHLRSLAKALSWRVFGTLISGAVVYALTGQLVLAAGISVAETLVKIGPYYLHERAWNRVGFGRAALPGHRLRRTAQSESNGLSGPSSEGGLAS